MKHISLWIPFFLALFFALLGTAFFSEIRIWAFAPFLAILYHRVSLSKALWISFSCGLLIDCLSSQFYFGLFSLNHTLASLLLYKQKNNFFEDKTIAFALNTTLIALFLSFFLLLFSCWSCAITCSLPLILSDLILMPFLDGLYALIWFTCPISLVLYLKKHGLKDLLPQKENA